MIHVTGLLVETNQHLKLTPILIIFSFNIQKIFEN